MRSVPLEGLRETQPNGAFPNLQIDLGQRRARALLWEGLLKMISGRMKMEMVRWLPDLTDLTGGDV